MPKKPVIDHEEKESLVPSISREEDRLKTFLDQARAQARSMVSEAEQTAEDRVRRALDELPARMEERRAVMLQASRDRTEALRGELAAETAKLLKKAGDNRQRAAEQVVSEVWPGETQ